MLFGESDYPFSVSFFLPLMNVWLICNFCVTVKLLY